MHKLFKSARIKKGAGQEEVSYFFNPKNKNIGKEKQNEKPEN
jgi:hypothetical protein